MGIEFQECTTSFETLFSAVRGRVLAYARKVAGPDLAEDIVQEVFLRLLTYKRGNLGPIPFSFILTMTRNVARTMQGKRARQEEVAEAAAEPARVVEPTPPASGAIEPSSTAGAALEMLQEMTERQREALYLTAVCGLSEIQAALAMAMSRAAISARKREALHKLREGLELAVREHDAQHEAVRAMMCA